MCYSAFTMPTNSAATSRYDYNTILFTRTSNSGLRLLNNVSGVNSLDKMDFFFRECIPSSKRSDYLLQLI